jgi:hypothetical protein
MNLQISREKEKKQPSYGKAKESLHYFRLTEDAYLHRPSPPNIGSRMCSFLRAKHLIADAPHLTTTGVRKL